MKVSMDDHPSLVICSGIFLLDKLLSKIICGCKMQVISQLHLVQPSAASPSTDSHSRSLVQLLQSATSSPLWSSPASDLANQNALSGTFRLKRSSGCFESTSCFYLGLEQKSDVEQQAERRTNGAPNSQQLLLNSLWTSRFMDIWVPQWVQHGKGNTPLCIPPHAPTQASLGNKIGSVATRNNMWLFHWVFLPAPPELQLFGNFLMKQFFNTKPKSVTCKTFPGSAHESTIKIKDSEEP